MKDDFLDDLDGFIPKYDDEVEPELEPELELEFTPLSIGEIIPPPEVIEDATPKKKRVRDRSSWKHVQGRLKPDEYRKFCIHMANIGVESKAEYIRSIIMKEVNSYGIQFVESDKGVQGTGDVDGGEL